MFQYNILRDSDIEQIGDSVFKVLEKVGVLCQNRELLKALEEAGARVDYSNETVFFTKRMCAELLEQIKKENQSSVDNAAKKFEKPSLPGLETQVAQFVYDYGNKQRRSGNIKDFIELIKLGDTLHPETSVGHSLLLTDAAPMIEPLEAGMLLAEYAHIPAPAFAWNVQQADYLVEMGEILGFSDWFTWGAVCFSHPFRFDKDVADRFVRIVRSGQSAGLTAMPVAGVTTPVTVAGFVTVATAEIFATWLSARALNPNVPLGGSIWGGTMDMKTGEVSYSSFDAMFYSFALSEFIRKWSGMFIHVGGGEYCDAKYPGYYAAMEKAYKAMTIASFTGVHPSIGQGMLEDGKTLCPVQLLLERELGIGVQFFGKNVDVSDETISLDDILDVGIGFNKSYLNTDKTLYQFSENLWCPQLMDRSGWNGEETDEAVLQKMQIKVHELIASYKKPEIDPDKLTKMRKVVERAKKEIK
jgi:trimethylamine--corrinoid protein Co-methyltransferase